MKKKHRAWIVLILLELLVLYGCVKSEVLTWQEQYNLGIKYLGEGNYEQAIIAFTAAIEIDPTRPEAYIKTAEAYVSAGDRDAAIAILVQGADATGDEALKTYLERLQQGPLTVLSYQAAYEADGTPCFEVRYSYDEKGYLVRSENRTANEDGELVYSSVETWECSEDYAKCTHTRSNGSTEEATVNPWYLGARYQLYKHLYQSRYPEEVGEDGILENWNSDPVNMLPRFDHAVYTFDEAGYPLTITTYGYESEVIGTAVAEWITLDLAM